jgi:hypothetical protein
MRVLLYGAQVLNVGRGFNGDSLRFDGRGFDGCGFDGRVVWFPTGGGGFDGTV